MKKQLEFKKTKGWGGRRKNAGRRNMTKTVNHMKREKVSLKTPLHLTLKLKSKLPSLRKKSLLKELKTSVSLAKAQGLYVIQFSIQDDHLHLFAEAENNASLALGMRSLVGRFAKTIRSVTATSDRRFKDQDTRKKGSVFAGRYHLHVLKTPRETKNALEYVLLNLSKHQKRVEYIDPYSSGSTFREWERLLGKRYGILIDHLANSPDLHEDAISRPQSWLAKKGWYLAS